MVKAFLALVAMSSLCAQQYRGFWADAFHKGYKSPGEIDQMIEDVLTAKANAIFVEVRHRGGSYYLKSLEPAVEDPEYLPNFDALQYLIEKAHARGIEVHAWFPVTPLWPLPRNPVDPNHAWNKHGPRAPGDQMWMTVSSTGQISSSVDPGHPDVFKYLADVILEPARHYDLDGLHLDYIRYPEDANYGWNPVAVSRFQRLNNRTGSPSAPDPRWAEFRRNQVTQLVRQIYLRAFAIRPSIKISAALITWGNGPVSDAEFQTKDAYSRVFQDWRGWLEEGILDLGIPMNYFRESANANFFDRWIEYEKDRQYRRGILIGPAIYLNPIADSMAQLRRVLAPSAGGNSVMGVNFYSYASTNTLNPAGLPVTPNIDFYRAAGDLFGGGAPVPGLTWKSAPTRGHIYGSLQVDNGPAWLKDGVGIIIENQTAQGRDVRTVTDGTGFFGAVDLEPGLYYVKVERAGKELFRTTPQQLTAGNIVRFEIFLQASDFTSVLPDIRNAAAGAAPGDIVEISGAALARAYAPASAVPLPLELEGAQVVVNGAAAPLYFVSPERIQFQIPYTSVENWNIVVRRAGLESNAFAIRATETNPKITGVVKRDGYLEIYSTGLGAVSPVIGAGSGPAAWEPFNRTANPVTVLIGDVAIEPLYSGLAPYVPGRYQVNVKLPQGVTSGKMRLQAGGRLSAPWEL